LRHTYRGEHVNRSRGDSPPQQPGGRWPHIRARRDRSAGHLAPADQARLQAIRARCPQIDAAVKHVAGFARMIKDRSGDKDTLTEWMAAVDHDLPALRSFTRGLRRDLESGAGESIWRARIGLLSRCS